MATPVAKAWTRQPTASADPGQQGAPPPPPAAPPPPPAYLHTTATALACLGLADLPTPEPTASPKPLGTPVIRRVPTPLPPHPTWPSVETDPLVGHSSIGFDPWAFDIEVRISQLPKLNEPFTVTGKFTLIEANEADVELWLSVPKGVYLDGEDRWHGPMKRGVERTLSATFAVVAQDNHRVYAYGYTDDPSVFGIVSQGTLPIRFHTTLDGSEPGYEKTESRARVFSPGQEVREVYASHTRMVETALLLNTSESPRIEFVQSEDDVVGLQEEGLFPQELRYRWRWLARVDFSKVFLMVYFDQMRPSPGHLPVFQATEPMPLIDGSFFIWEDGVLKGDYTTYSVPEGTVSATSPVSSVTMKVIGRATQQPYSDFTPYQGLREFEFTIDGGPPVPVQVNFPMLPPPSKEADPC